MEPLDEEECEHEWELLYVNTFWTGNEEEVFHCRICDDYRYEYIEREE